MYENNRPNENLNQQQSGMGNGGSPTQNAPMNGENPYRWSQPAAPQQQSYSTTNGWQQPPQNQSQNDPYQWNFQEYEHAREEKPKRKNRGMVVFSIVLASALTIGLVSFAGVGIYSVFSNNAGPSKGSTLEVPASNLPGMTIQNKPDSGEVELPDGRLTTEQIVKKVEPSIVAITTYVNYQNYQASGLGSGIIIRDDGYIVTNAHVVNGAKGITVILSDGETKYEGRIIGMDTKTDLAVIKVDANGLTPAVFGNSDQIAVGEKVLAIGSPQSLEFSGSVTQGIVSGLNRTLSAADSSGQAVTTYANLIQTDAAINPGNSGGALVNEYGQVIGINSAKVIANGSDGMGFAIPANEANPIVDDLINHGYVTGRVKLGITASAVDEVLARLNGVPTGLIVQSTEPNSDISKKGVVPGDIITKADGNDLDGFQSLSEALDGKKPGDTVELEVYRSSTRRNENGRFFSVTVKLAEDTSGKVGQATEEPVQQIPSETIPNEQPQQDDFERFEEFFNRFFN